MKEWSKYPLPTVFQNRYVGPSHSDYNIFQHVTKSLKRKIVHPLYPRVSEEHIY